jgi:hypothetical protein
LYTEIKINGSKAELVWVWWGKLRERTHLQDVVVDGRIILKWILS